MPDSNTLKLRVLAFIDRIQPRGARNSLLDQNTSGYVLDVTVQVEPPDAPPVIIQHYGDGLIYQTLEEAESRVLAETGLTLERLQTERDPHNPWSCAAYFVGEFALSDKPEAAVIAESGVPRHDGTFARLGRASKR